mmetsp:Transcript_11260/g.69543  ORF Transcript_11260/g.69543 Transcript_11260/m.69543 type:complete len:88 (+) Transcript_11260:262-525(+)
MVMGLILTFTYGGQGTGELYRFSISQSYWTATLKLMRILFIFVVMLVVIMMIMVMMVMVMMLVVVFLVLLTCAVLVHGWRIVVMYFV